MTQLPNSVGNKDSSYKNSLHLEVPAEAEHVGYARRAVAEFIRQQAWTTVDADELLLALGEACSNAVMHGNFENASPTISVSCRPLDAQRLQVEVQNAGNNFQPDLETLAVLPKDEFAAGGRGFALMQALVDTVQVTTENGKTTVRLTKTKTA